jgi:hypothetical protein
MNMNSQTPIGDLSGGDSELGVPTQAMVERRAREIARLNERNPEEFTNADLEQARAELSVAKATEASQDSIEIADCLSERDSIPGETGRRASRRLPKDEALVDERLAERGVEEAAHDQMVAAARENQKQEG